MCTEAQPEWGKDKIHKVLWLNLDVVMKEHLHLIPVHRFLFVFEVINIDSYWGIKNKLLNIFKMCRNIYLLSSSRDAGQL